MKIIEGNGKEPLLDGSTIGNGSVSKTVTPNIHVDLNNEIILFDYPGFLDTGDHKQEIINAFSIDYLLSSSVTDTKFKYYLFFQQIMIEIKISLNHIINSIKLSLI